ncbi:hypothetical protein NEIMUCOT_03909 [Neisseria mucosa ATCC 25996]|uniref:Uncharacterized protein n=1 Tax=Neisseria mucosa (strain ATCC 25996 / DSM 4631 / NCTC 10774 / M26) TaxID=546266 RepID=D2ZTH3_NEIM2|nr:hypothetical protein NEIMUCOT_03909 [Neisseria mucosa ATCC 25996]
MVCRYFCLDGNNGRQTISFSLTLRQENPPVATFPPNSENTVK